MLFRWMRRAAARVLRRAPGQALAVMAAAVSPAAAQCGGDNLIDRLEAQAPAEAAALREAAAANPDPFGRFWRVEKPDAPPSHIFGTFHATEPEVAVPPAEVREALEAARVAFVEITPEEQAEMQRALQSNPALIMDMEGGTLDDFLTPEQRALAGRVLKPYGMDYFAARRLKPWFVQIITAQPPCAIAAMQKGAKVLDTRLAEIAESAGVPVRGLETWEDSLGVFMNQTPAEQRAGLLLALAMADRAEDFRRTAIDLYLDGEIMMIWEFGRHVARQAEEIEDADALNDRFWDEVVVSRNVRFLEAAAEDLEAGGAFLAVGALHLGGEGGMLGSLREMGYEVTRLPLDG